MGSLTASFVAWGLYVVAVSQVHLTVKPRVRPSATEACHGSTKPAMEAPAILVNTLKFFFPGTS